METVACLRGSECNGCRVCADLCAKGAIRFARNEQNGFDFPVVDESKCARCGFCVKKCPQRQPVRMSGRRTGQVLAAWSEDDEVRMFCTSGGIFYELGRQTIEHGGVVVACSYTEDYRGAYHHAAKTEEGLRTQCGSKHVQSRTLHIYKETKEYLDAGIKVMFVGTPCQVAALYRYLGEDPAGLLTADLICNSINSPKAQEKYIDYLEDVYGSKLVFSRAKDKRNGWNHFGSSARFENGAEYFADRNTDARVLGYHRGHLFIRESCEKCQYKVLPRNADITLGDFWGIREDSRNPKLEEGTSLVMLNSKKGERAVELLGDRVGSYTETMEDALSGNAAFLKPAVSNGNGPRAFRALDGMRFDKVVDRYRDRDSFVAKAKRRIAKTVREIRDGGRNR